MREAKAVDFDVLTISPYGTLLAHDKIEYVSGCCVFHVAVALMAWGVFVGTTDTHLLSMKDGCWM